MPDVDPQAIAQQLLSPGPGYLISAFQAEDREDRLGAIAEAFPLRAALERSAPAGAEASQWLLTDTFEARWIRLLDRAVATMPNTSVRVEVTAIVRALEAASHDGRGRSDFWVDAASRLEGRSVSVGTLRNRRWPLIKPKLAEAIARLMSPPEVHTLPFEPEVPSLFDEEDFLDILERLDSDLDGLAVLIDEPGVGKTNLANAYGHWAQASQIGRSRYDRVVWLRGDDPIVMAGDFFSAGRVLDPTVGFEGSADVQSVLQRTDGWLLLIDDVRDPASILRFLPTRTTGHVICTSDVRAGEAQATREERRRAAAEVWQEHFGASLFDFSRDRLIKAPSTRAIQDLLDPEAVEDEAFGLIATAAGGSRLALRVAAVWSSMSEDPRPLAAWSERIRAVSATLRQAEPFVGLADRPGVVAAAALFLWADGPGRDRFDGGVALPKDESPYELLHRLEPFASHPIPIDAFHGGADDPRVERLVALGMGLRLRYLDGDSVALADDVRTALRFVHHLASKGGSRSFAAAGLTALMLSEPDPQCARSAISPATVPHLVSLAGRLAEAHHGVDPLPTTALVLRARAAIAYRSAGSPRRARDQLTAFESILADGALREIVAADLVAGRERGWAQEVDGDAAEMLTELDLRPPADRLIELIPSLRRCGDRAGALRIYRSLHGLFEEVAAPANDPRLQTARWTLRVEGALSMHDNGDLEQSTESLLGLLDEVGDHPIRSQLEAMLARDAQDRGDLVRGSDWLSSAWRRVSGAAVVEESVPWADLARIYAGAARGARYAGWSQSAASTALLAAACWERASPAPSPAHAFAASNAAASLAREALPGALRLAEASVDEVTLEAGAYHHDTALIRLNHAFVQSSLIGSAAVAKEAESAFRTVITHWPRRHPFTLRARLLAASCLAAAGSVTEALRHLLVLIDNSGLERWLADREVGTAHDDYLLVRTVGWLELAMLLVRAVPHIVVEGDSDLELVILGEARSHEILATAIDAFAVTDLLLERAVVRRSTEVDGDRDIVPSVAYEHHEGLRLATALGRLEARIRLGEAAASDALEVVAASRRSSAGDRERSRAVLHEAASRWSPLGGIAPTDDASSPSISVLRALAKLVRVAPPPQHLETDDDLDRTWFTPSYWRGLLGPDDAARGGLLLTAQDRVEFTMAWQAATDSEIEDGAAGIARSDDDLKALEEHIEGCIGDLRVRSGDGPDHEQALWYSILAQVPFEKGTNHRRARNLREVARNRARLSSADLEDVRRRLEIERQGVARGRSATRRFGGPR